MPRPPAELSAEHQRRLARLRRRRARADAALELAIDDALADGQAPAAIARALGISKQAFHDRQQVRRSIPEQDIPSVSQASEEADEDDAGS